MSDTPPPFEEGFSRNPGSSDLRALREMLAVFASRPRPLSWGNPEKMWRANNRVQEVFGVRPQAWREARRREAVLAFRLRRQEVSYSQLKYACRSLALRTDLDGRRLIDDPQLLPLLLEAVGQLATVPRKLRLCCQGLAQSLLELSLDPDPLPPGAATVAHIARVRTCLASWSATGQRSD